MFEIFDALDEKQWSGEIVSHTFMGPLPACFFAAFQLIDYSIHSWDIKAGLGRDEPLSDEAAITLIPFMLIVIQYTVDAERCEGPQDEVRDRDQRPGRRQLVRRRRRHDASAIEEGATDGLRRSCSTSTRTTSS